jgi:hypothetical protein
VHKIRQELASWRVAKGQDHEQALG